MIKAPNQSATEVIKRQLPNSKPKDLLRINNCLMFTQLNKHITFIILSRAFGDMKILHIFLKLFLPAKKTRILKHPNSSK